MITEFFIGKEIEIPEDVKRMLQFSERVLLAAEQARSASLVTPDTIFVTTQRVIQRRPTALGLRKNIEDYRYVDIANVKLSKGIIRSSIELKMRFSSEDAKFENFPKEVADKMFRLIQDGVAGRLSLAQPQDAIIKTANVAQQSIIDEIKELAKLQEQGILTEVEFQTKKAELLARL